MAERYKIYKCNVCGNVVEVLDAGQGDLVCCGQPMELQVEKAEDKGKEKHVPVVNVKGNNVRINVGSVPHPMEDTHYIGMIEVLSGDYVIASARLSPREEPRAEFCLENLGDPKDIRARIWCNVHGVWKS